MFTVPLNLQDCIYYCESQVTETSMQTAGFKRVTATNKSSLASVSRETEQELYLNGCTLIFAFSCSYNELATGQTVMTGSPPAPVQMLAQVAQMRMGE